MPCYSFSGLVPIVASSAFVHPSACLIGDVWVGEDCYIGPFASLRGDFGRIVVQAGSNIQDSCTLHSFPGADCLVAENGHVGHGAVLHGCSIGAAALIGIKAVVMDRAVIGADAIIGAMSFIKSNLEIPPRVLAFGNPARVIRELTQQELEWKKRGTAEYQELARLSHETLKEQTPLTEPERDRARLGGSYQPLFKSRSGS
jgi:phenylacetic acid degradation protein